MESTGYSVLNSTKSTQPYFCIYNLQVNQVAACHEFACSHFMACNGLSLVNVGTEFPNFLGSVLREALLQSFLRSHKKRKKRKKNDGQNFVSGWEIFVRNLDMLEFNLEEL